MNGIKEYHKFTFVTDKFREISKVIHEIDEDILGHLETYYENGWLCGHCGTFYKQRLVPTKCWKCEENMKNGMSTSPGSDWMAI